MQLPTLLDAALPCVQEAAAAVLRLFHSREYSVSEKAPGDPLTTADLESNEILHKGLMRLLPGAAWISEESDQSQDRLAHEFAWIVDPIDGTREFASGVPEFSISVGLSRNGQAVLGIVALPASGEIIAGCVGAGLHMHSDAGRQACGLSHSVEQLSEARILTSATEHRQGVFRDFPADLQLVPTGSVARKLALVAAGRADLNISLYPKNEWDICGGVALVLAAGGMALRYDPGLDAWVGHSFNGENLRSLGLIAGSSTLARAFAERQMRERWPIRTSYGE